MKRMWMVGVVALLVGALAATPARAAAKGGNSANAKLCQKDGWETLYQGDGSKFANQGDCVSYGAKGNTILTAPPNPWRAACEQAGGTFSVNRALGFPFPPSAYEYVCSPVSEGTWAGVLNEICFGFPDGLTAAWAPTNGGTGDCIRSGTT